MILIVFPIEGYSQTENCTYLEDWENFSKAQEFIDTEVDSFKKYIRKFISTNNNPCQPPILNHYIDLFKSESILKLAEIEYYEDDHLKTNDYLKSLSDQEREILQLRAKYNYYNIDNNQAALKFLLPHVMSFFKIGTDSKLVQVCVKLLIEEYDREYLIYEYHKSILSFSQESSGHYRFFTRFMGVDILLGLNLPYGTPNPQDHVSQYMKSQEFYKLLIK